MWGRNGPNAITRVLNDHNCLSDRNLGRERSMVSEYTQSKVLKVCHITIMSAQSFHTIRWDHWETLFTPISTLSPREPVFNGITREELLKIENHKAVSFPEEIRQLVRRKVSEDPYKTAVI